MSPISRDDIERLVRLEAKVDDLHEDLAKLTALVDSQIRTHDREIARLKVMSRIVAGVLTAAGSAIGLPWLANILKIVE